MMTISMTNRNLNSLHQNLTIRIPSGICFSEETQQTFSKSQLSSIGFEHPLLEEPIFPRQQREYVYEYDDFDGWLSAATVVFSTLLFSENPETCRWVIRPSARFLKIKAPYVIPFSMHPNRRAKMWLKVEQLNVIASYLYGYSFQYQDSFVLDKTITFDDLPEQIDADALYTTHLEVVEFCKRLEHISQYDVRYFGRCVGFGVFARTMIQKNDKIAVYYGIKTVREPGHLAYVFREKQDCLKMDLDAKYSGGLARFINHAATNHGVGRENEICRANLQALTYQVRGNDVVIFVALRQIHPGEQLLVDYGEKYFHDKGDVIYWQHNGKMVNAQGKKIKGDSARQRHWLLKQSLGVNTWSSFVLTRATLMLLLFSALFWVIRK